MNYANTANQYVDVPTSAPGLGEMATDRKAAKGQLRFAMKNGGVDDLSYAAQLVLFFFFNSS